MKLKILAGSTGRIARVFIQDSTSTTGAGLTGLAYNTSGLSWYYSREGDAGATAVPLATATVGTYTSGGFVAVDGTNMAGMYEIGIPAVSVASGAKSVHMMLKGATNMVPLPIEIELDAVNYQSANDFITGINALAPPANWNLEAIDASGRVDIGKWLGSAPDALSSGKLPADVKLWLATAPAAVTTSGYIQTALQRWLTDNLAGTPNALASNRVDASVGAYPGNTAQTGDNFARIGVAGAGLTALGDTRIANLDATVSSRSTYAGGAVASVTGAVGSVTGNVGGNVVGSVGSVVGAVGSVTAGVTVATNSDKTGYALTAAYDAAKTAAAAGAQMDLINAPNATALTAIGASVWATTTRTLSGFGTLAADVATAVWGAVTRTLTAFSDSSGVTTLLTRLGAPVGADISHDIAAVGASASSAASSASTAATNAAAATTAANAAPAATLTAFQASADWKLFLADVDGAYAYTPPVAFPGTGTLVLKDKTNTTTLATITLGFDSGQNIISRSVA